MALDYNIIGQRIKQARLSKNLTQEDLAEQIDISVAFLSRVERGKAQLNLKRLIQIAEVLKIAPGYLLTGSNITSKDYLREDFRIILEKCTPEQQRLIYQISELISKTKFEAVNI